MADDTPQAPAPEFTVAYEPASDRWVARWATQPSLCWWAATPSDAVGGLVQLLAHLDRVPRAGRLGAPR